MLNRRRGICGGVSSSDDPQDQIAANQSFINQRSQFCQPGALFQPVVRRRPAPQKALEPKTSSTMTSTKLNK